jgi:hypothetical protein
MPHDLAPELWDPIADSELQHLLMLPAGCVHCMLCLSCSDGKTTSTVGSSSGLKATMSQLPACKGISSVEVQQTPSGIDAIKYYVNDGSQKVLLSASGNITSTASTTTFNAPAENSLLAGLSGDLRNTTTGTQMVRVICI